MQTFIQSTQTAESIPFSPGSGITATNVQAAIVQASTMGGSGGSGGFSYKRITMALSIPTDQQMIVFQSINIDGGTLTLDGELVII